MGGWTDGNDLQRVGDFLGLGYDQVMFINNGGSGGRAMIADYHSGSPMVRFWDSWDGTSLLSGWHDPNDLVMSGRLM